MCQILREVWCIHYRKGNNQTRCDDDRLTDGHSSRFDISVLQFCQDHNIRQFLSTPDTTGLLQPLDQINAKLHTAYREGVENLFVAEHISHGTFMIIILGQIWPNWTTADTTINAFKRCGITKDWWIRPSSVELSYCWILGLLKSQHLMEGRFGMMNLQQELKRKGKIIEKEIWCLASPNEKCRWDTSVSRGNRGPHISWKVQTREKEKLPHHPVSREHGGKADPRKTKGAGADRAKENWREGIEEEDEVRPKGNVP